MDKQELKIDKTRQAQLNKNPFEVPDGYFDSFTDRLNDTIETNEIPVQRKVIKILKPLVALAAAMFILFFTIQQTIQYLNIDAQSSVLSEEQSITLELDFLNITEDLIVEDLYSDLYTQPSTEEIIEYLVNDNIDLSDISNL